MENKEKILLAEDDMLIKDIIQEIITDDFELIVANNGKEAVELAKKEQPAVLLLDIMMPEKDGFTVCEELRADEKLNKTIIVMITALADRDSREKGYKTGADDFITKPFNPLELRSKIQLLSRMRKRLIS